MGVFEYVLPGESIDFEWDFGANKNWKLWEFVEIVGVYGMVWDFFSLLTAGDYRIMTS